MMIVATHGILKSPADTLDVDVRAFINATGISDSMIASALQTLVTTLKANSLWAKFDAIYPFVGGNSFTHKFNLKNPADTDAAFRLGFAGGWTHSATGAKANGAGYANTYYNESILANINDKHISIYNRLNILSLQTSIGVTDNATQAMDITPRYAIGGSERCIARCNTQAAYFDNDDSRGFYMADRNSSTTMTGRKNAISHPIMSTGLSQLNVPYYIGASCVESNGMAAYRSTNQFAFASIGRSFTDLEAVIFYNAVQTFQTSLGRQV